MNLSLSRTVLVFFLLVLLSCIASAQQDATCSILKPCKSGCCSSLGNCGFGPDFCGDGCQGTCNAKAECGKYAAEDSFDCPLNVCCSKYGFCGTTSEFCNKDCQNEGGCPPVSRKTCGESTNAMDMPVRVGYYGMWSASRGCDSMQPENIPAGVLTTINLAFAYVSADNEITDDEPGIVARVSRLKKKYSGLRVNIAIGGWVFNDPPTQFRFSNMVSTRPNRDKFVASLVRFIRHYGLNGVDLDWEYPVAEDRGGKKEDYSNFVLLCSEIRDAFDAEDPGWELTLTLPASYWYLRGFNLKNLEKYVDYFNVMTYDIHGLWDQGNVWTGPFLKGHTNLTEIEEGLDLLWRNGVSPDKVVMGFGFYGRSFTMEDTSCTTPPNCRFSGAGFAGDCTREAGILSYSEVQGHKSQLGSQVYYDEQSSVKWMVYGSNQWISYDDEESFEAKKRYMFSRCLRGLMLWSLDLDTQDHQAMTALFGEEAMEKALIQGSGLDADEAGRLAFDLSAYTGERCYTTPTCTDGTDGEKTSDQVCKSGFTPVQLAHAPEQRNSDYDFNGECSEGWWRYICCPTKAQPKNCEWVGAPERSVFGCDRGCGASQIELNVDSYLDAKGKGNCYSGMRSLCCDGTEILKKCSWTGCGKSCRDDETEVATRYDDSTGERCERGLEIGGVDTSSFCCPKDDSLEKCDWGQKDCKPAQCSSETIKMTSAFIPADQPNKPHVFDSGECFKQFATNSFAAPDFPLCCEPPSRFSQEWPVEPKYLWSNYYDDKDDDVSWDFSNNFGNNNKDTTPNDLEEDPGDDPYGFVMLDGPPGSINDAFHTQFTVLTDEEPVSHKKRSIITTNQTILDTVFDHAEETIRVYCNHPADSKECRKTFYKGAEDTIIRLPDHVGEGPWARIVRMEPEPTSSLPAWAIRKRGLTANQNGVYVLKFDYNFHLIKRDDGPVNMRVDYTNILPYWDEITDSPVKRRKRSMDESLSFLDWKDQVDKAKNSERVKKRASRSDIQTAQMHDVVAAEDAHQLDRRWFGTFVRWLEKLNKIIKTDGGVLPMGLSRAMTLYSGRLRCVNGGTTITAGLDITADFNMKMDAKYSYYFSGTVVPPAVTDMYAYVGVHPSVYAGLGVTGNAELYYQSERRKIIDTLTYPGLAIKGIAAVGPTLDLWGQITGSVILSGDLRVGLEYRFKPVELYFPNNGEARNVLDVQDLEKKEVDQSGLIPTIAGNVRADVDFNIHATPEINLGIIVGGAIGPIKEPLAKAQVSAFANTTLNFHAYAAAGFENADSGWEYGYSVSFLYRFGFGCIASIIKYGKWSPGIFYPISWREIPIVPLTTIKSDQNSKRSLENVPRLSEDPLPNPVFGVGAQLQQVVEAEHNYDNATLFVRQEKPGEETEFPKTEFKLGDFKCTTGGGSRCGASTPASRRRSLEYAANTTDTSPVRRGMEAVRLQKRAATDCPRTFPRLYYNCESTFYDQTLTGPAGVQTFTGICNNIQGFLQNNGLGNTGYQLTWDSETTTQSRRRSSVCDGFCTTQNTNAKLATLGPASGVTNMLNCDEFPFASSEQGGSGFLGVNPTTLTGVVRTCVPTWQNDIQGRCNELLNSLETNVEYFNDPKKPTQDNPYWAPWDRNQAPGGGWLRKDGFDGRNILIPYPQRQPDASGMTANERADPRNLSYKHKRNFLLFLSYPRAGNNPDAQWPNQNYQSGTISGTDRDGPPTTTTVGASTWVMCAVNHMGQQRYRYRQGRHNGMCSDGTRTRPVWRGAFNQLSYFRCKINFVGTPGPAKRDQTPMGHIGGEPYYGIERIDDEMFTALIPNPDHKPETSTADETANGSDEKLFGEALSKPRRDHVQRHSHHHKHSV